MHGWFVHTSEVERLDVRVLAGDHHAVSDIAVEWRPSLNVPSPPRANCVATLRVQAAWRSVTYTPNAKNDGAREDLRFRCKTLTPTYVRCSLACGRHAAPGSTSPVRVLLHAQAAHRGLLAELAPVMP